MHPIAPFPAAAALHRRAARQEAQGQVFPPRVIENREGEARRRRRNRNAAGPDEQEVGPNQQHFRFANVYSLISILAALLAIVVAPHSGPSPTLATAPSRFLDKAPEEATHPFDLSTVENVAKAGAIGLGSSENGNGKENEHNTVEENQQQQHANPPPMEFDSLMKSFMEFLFPAAAPSAPLERQEAEDHRKETSSKKQHPVPEDHRKETPSKKQHHIPPPFRWMFPSHDDSTQDELDSPAPGPKNPLRSFMLSLVDPTLFQPRASSMTEIIDKVLSSNARLLAIANLLLAMTYLVHTAVVDMFLGADSIPNEFGFLAEEPSTVRGAANGWAGRERLGGFLVFKLLLISAVVVPDKLDLLILLSWYTLLSFLRSLAHLAAATTAHTSQSGQPPRRGVLRLLLAVLVSDACAAAVCVALFHGAGWGMVLLLACDCALLGVEVLCHILRHASQAMEERHSNTVRQLEDRQLALHRLLREQRRNQNETEHTPDTDLTSANDDASEVEEDIGSDNQRRREESRQLDRRMEIMEGSHSRRLGILDATVFFLQLVAYILTVGHFCHIWSLHGLHFTLIDGVLALHLHSAVSSLGKKIAERRNLNRVARALDGLFEDATELEMRKASATGDVCCICLGTMTVGHVKKVGCGHLYHTRCLREVVERARSIEAARCPLCRASVVDGRHPSSTSTDDGAVRNNEQQDGGNNNPEQQHQRRENNGALQQQQPPVGVNNNAGGEHALFRFSTENILPAWLPLPAFSFEVVRRPTGVAPQDNTTTDNNNNGAPPPPPPPPHQQRQAQAAGDRNNNGQRPQQQQSFWRRLLVLSGAIPMSPEEEARALDQLVDMFPQYDRADLQRELRDRGSPDAVVEAVLQGVFSGVARGGGGAVVPNNRQEPNNQEANEEERAEDLLVQEENDSLR